MNSRLKGETKKKDLIRDLSFPKQDAFVTDPDRFITAQCSRRAGKSNGLALRFLRTLQSHPGCLCPYIALTRESARNIMWGILQEQDAKFRMGCEFTESNLTVTHPNGARLQLFGADMRNFIRRLKGIKTPGAAIDEAQDFGGHLQSLVDDVLSPTLTDYSDSWLAITGTPGPVPNGFFYEITELKKYGFSQHRWTLYDNPYLPEGKKFVDELRQKRGWEENHPTFRREWKNEWVLDLESLVVKYRADRNHYEGLPPAAYHHLLGIDLGLRDADALAILAWTERSKEIFLVEEVITPNQDITTLTHQINLMISKYGPEKIVMDTGGLGAKIAEELRRRHSLPILAADKKRKFENIALLNDWLGLGHFKARVGSRFAQDSFRLTLDWEKSTPDRLVVSDNFHSDIIDAVLYAFRESPAWTHVEPAPKLKYGSKEWATQEVSDMERAAEEFFENQEQIEKENEW